MSKVCKHCDLAWDDRAPAMFCLSCGRPLVHIDDSPEDYKPVNKKHAVATGIWLSLLALFILISLCRNYTPCVEIEYDFKSYLKKTPYGSFILKGSDQYGRIDVVKESGRTYFYVDYKGEKYTAELTWDKTDAGEKMAHIIYSDGLEYYGIYDKWGIKDITDPEDFPEYRFPYIICRIDREDWDYRGDAGVAFWGGWIYFWGFLGFWVPDFAHAAATRRMPVKELTQKDRKGVRISGIVIMIAAMVVLTLIVSDDVPHHRVHFH